MSTLTLSLGVVEVAILISSVLYGVTTLQAWLYAERFSNDPLYVRTAVRTESSISFMAHFTDITVIF